MSSLIIKESEVDDAGVYKAVAKNRAGEVEAEAEVIVEGRLISDSIFVMFCIRLDIRI